MHQYRIAVMIDGAFFLKRLFYKYPHLKSASPEEVAKIIHSHSLKHTFQKTGRRQENRAVSKQYDLYRIFFYDCPPFEKKMHWPMTEKSINFATTPQAIFRRGLHKELLKKRKVALRLGHLVETVSWRIKADAQKKIIRRKLAFDALEDRHFEIDTKQKGVDMRLGLDVAALSYKQLVDQIVLIVGDSDFVPAAKVARREGIDIIIDPLGQTLHEQLQEHTDGVRSPGINLSPRNTNEIQRPMERLAEPETIAASTLP